VDSIKARLDAIPAILKRFRQSVLAAAVSGRLTEDWRRTMSLSGWEQVILLDVVQAKPRNGYSPKAVDYETPYRNLTLSATTQGKFIDGMFKFVDIEVDEDSYLWVKRGDLLIQRANTYEYVGVSARYTGESNRYVYPDLMMKCTPNERILGEFLHYCLLSQSTRKYFQVNATGTAGNMPKINQKVVSNTPISLPPLPEQIEVVGRVEQFFTLADRIEQHIIDAQNRASQLTQSILSKAFKGDLTADWRAQNPDLISGENSAEALLKRIQAQRAAQPKGTRKKHAGKNKGAAT
jgi:type I restriction enzyme S subunit